MKTLFVLALLCCETPLIFSQTQVAPEVQFNNYYFSNELPDANQQTQDNSGEDWFYGFNNTFESNNWTGFICAGYSTYPTLVNTNSHLNAPTNFNENNLDINQVWGHGPSQPKLAFVDRNGKLEWYKNYGSGTNYYGTVYPEGGRFYNAIQLSNGDCLAVGQIEIDGGPSYIGANNQSGLFESHIATNVLDHRDYRHAYVARVSPYGDQVNWEFQYGHENFSNSLNKQSNAFDIIPYGNTDDYFICGFAELAVNGTKYRKPWLAEIDGIDGHLIKDMVCFQTETDNSAFRNMYYDATTGYIYLTGKNDFATNQADAIIVRIDAATFNQPTSGDIITIQSTNSSSVHTNSYTTSISFDGVHDQILVGCVYNNYDGYSNYETGANHAEGRVYRIDISTFAIVKHTEFSDIFAYDLNIGVEATSTGGFYVVSTIQPTTLDGCDPPLSNFSPGQNCSSDPNNSRYFDKFYWRSNAFVALYDYTPTSQPDDLVWSKTIEESTPPTNYGNYDFTNIPPTTFGYIGDPRDQGDLKREECYYKIRQTPDGGVTVCGNNSNNLDDDVLIKLFPNCQSNLSYDVDLPAGDFYYPLGTSATSGSWPSTVTKINAEVHVIDGQILTIDNQQLEFADSRQMGKPVKIVVEPGGHLIITDNSTLSGLSDCSGMWEGIDVEGSPSQSQTASNQGWLEVEDVSTLENMFGVVADITAYSTTYVGGTAIPDYSNVRNITGTGGGGIVQCSDATFLNCWKGVSLMPYSDASATDENLSYIRNCTFTNDVSLPFYYVQEDHESGPNEMISMLNVHGVDIRGNTFENLLSDQDPLDRGAAIVSIDADYEVTSYTPVLNQSSIPNTFYGYANGIHASFTNSAYMHKPLRITDNTFDNTNYSITVSGATLPFLITKNIITHFPTDLSCGIYLDGCSHYIVTENSIEANSADYQFGIVANKSGEDNNMLYKNNLTSLGYGTDAFYNNGNPNATPIATGLNFKCNTYTLNQNDIGVLPSTGLVNTYQGKCPSNNDPNFPQVPANNLFDLSCTSSVCNFQDGNASCTVKYAYFVWGQSPNYYEPVNHSSIVTLVPCQTLSEVTYENACPSWLKKLDEIPDDEKTSYRLTQIDSVSEIIDALQQLINGGDEAWLYQEIENPLLDANQLYEVVKNISPYLTDDVLKAIIDRTDPLTYNQLKDIVLAQSPLSDDVYVYLTEHRPAIAINNEVLEAQYANESVIQHLQSEIVGYQGFKSSQCNLALFDLLSRNETDSAIWLTSNYHLGKQTLFNLYQLENDSTSAAALLESIRDSNQCSDDYYTWMSSSIEDTSEMRALTYEDDPVSALAKSKLELLTNHVEQKEFLYPDVNSERLNHDVKHLPSLILAQNIFDVSPNPSNGQDVVIQLKDGSWLESELSLQILDLNDQLLFVQKLDEMNKEIFIENLYLNPGFYVAILKSGNAIIGHQFIVIQ